MLRAPNRFSHCSLAYFALALFQDRDVGVGAFPEHTVISLQIANADLIAYTPFGVETNAELQVPCCLRADTHEVQNDEHAKPDSRCVRRNKFFSST